MAAVMTREAMAAAYRAALERKKRERRNEYQSYSLAEERQAWVEGRTLKRISISAPEYRDPENLAEWIDDRLIERRVALHGLPESPVLYAVLAAARESTAAAAGALKAARGLAPAVQYCVYENLQLWRQSDAAGRTGADRLAAALSGEWSRLKLPEQDPALTEKPARRRRRWETVTEGAA